MAESAPGAGGPRSAPTRLAILEAARRAFAARGFERTTIRGVAAEAGIDPSMVMRYFGSKTGLFAAAATRNLDVPDLNPIPHEHRGEFLVRHFVERWELSAGKDTVVFLLRSAVTDDTVAKRLEANLEDLIARPLAAAGETDAEQRGALIATQLLGLALCRYVLRLGSIAAATPERAIAATAPAVQLYLDMALAGAGTRRRGTRSRGAGQRG